MLCSKIGKCFKKESDKTANNPVLLYTLCEDNSALIQRLSGEQQSTIYPPPTGKNLACIEYCMSLDRIFILLEKGTICIYRIDIDTAILEKLQYPTQLKDSENKSITQSIGLLKFVSSTPPRFDCEIFNERQHRKENFFKTSVYDMDYAHKFMLLVILNSPHPAGSLEGHSGLHPRGAA